MAAGGGSRNSKASKKSATKTKKPAADVCYLPLAHMPTVEAGESHFLSLPLPPEWLIQGDSGASNTSQEEDDSPPPTGSPPRIRAAALQPEAQQVNKSPLQQGTTGKKRAAKRAGKGKGGGKAAKGGGAGGSKKRSAAAASSSAASKPASKTVSAGVFSDKQLATIALAREKQERLDRKQAAAAAATAGADASSHPPASPRRLRPSPPSAFSEKDASMAILLGLAGMKPRPRSSALMDDASFLSEGAAAGGAGGAGGEMTVSTRLALAL